MGSGMASPSVTLGTECSAYTLPAKGCMPSVLSRVHDEGYAECHTSVLGKRKATDGQPTEMAPATWQAFAECPRVVLGNDQRTTECHVAREFAEYRTLASRHSLCRVLVLGTALAPKGDMCPPLS
jgi:hypothetical protein